MPSTGPKISSCAIAISVVTSPNSVGCDEQSRTGLYLTAAAYQPRTSLAALLDVAEDLVVVLRRDDRAELSARIERIADAHPGQLFGDELFECRGDRAFDNKPAAADAALAGVEAHAEYDPVGGILEVGIGKDDLRVLAAELQAELLEVAGRSLQRPPACRRRAGEGHHVDVGMLGDRLSDLGAEPCDDVEHAGGQSCLGQDVRHDERRGRGEFGGLANDRAAGGQNERHTFGEDEEREIPRRDQAHDADRLARDQTEDAVAKIVEGLAMQHPRRAGGIFVDVGRALDFAARLADRLAGLQRFEQRQSPRRARGCPARPSAEWRRARPKIVPTSGGPRRPGAQP